VAVVELDNSTELTVNEVGFITETIRIAVTKNLDPNIFLIMTQQNIEQLVPREKRLECLSEQCIIKLGRLLQAKYVIGGRLSHEGTKMGVVIQAYRVEDSALVCAEKGEARNLEEMVGVVESMTKKLVTCFLERTGFQAPTTVPITKGKAVEETPGIVSKPRQVTLPKDWEDKTTILVVESEPEGATVYLDGERVGTTPFQKLDVPVGTHHIFVEHGELYLPYEWTGKIPAEGLMKKIILIKR
jgi:hypothetical protein